MIFSIELVLFVLLSIHQVLANPSGPPFCDITNENIQKMMSITNHIKDISFFSDGGPKSISPGQTISLSTPGTVEGLLLTVSVNGQFSNVVSGFSTQTCTGGVTHTDPSSKTANFKWTAPQSFPSGVSKVSFRAMVVNRVGPELSFQYIHGNLPVASASAGMKNKF